MRALIVEDEILVALDLERALEEEGIEVVGIAADIASALAIAGEIDFALVDLNLRDGFTGPQIGHLLAERGVRVMFLTANPGLLGDGVEGTVGVMSKPFQDEALKAVVGLLAERRQPDPAPTCMRLFGPL